MVSKLEQDENEDAENRGEVLPDTRFVVVSSNPADFWAIVDAMGEDKASFIKKNERIDKDFAKAFLTDRDDVDMQSCWNELSPG